MSHAQGTNMPEKAVFSDSAQSSDLLSSSCSDIESATDAETAVHPDTDVQVGAGVADPKGKDPMCWRAVVAGILFIVAAVIVAVVLLVVFVATKSHHVYSAETSTSTGAPNSTSTSTAGATTPSPVGSVTTPYVATSTETLSTSLAPVASCQKLSKADCSKNHQTNSADKPSLPCAWLGEAFRCTAITCSGTKEDDCTKNSVAGSACAWAPDSVWKAAKDLTTSTTTTSSSSSSKTASGGGVTSLLAASVAASSKSLTSSTTATTSVPKVCGVNPCALFGDEARCAASTTDALLQSYKCGWVDDDTTGEECAKNTMQQKCSDAHCSWNETKKSCGAKRVCKAGQHSDNHQDSDSLVGKITAGVVVGLYALFALCIKIEQWRNSRPKKQADLSSETVANQDDGSKLAQLGDVLPLGNSTHGLLAADQTGLETHDSGDVLSQQARDEQLGRRMTTSTDEDLLEWQEKAKLMGGDDIKNSEEAKKHAAWVADQSDNKKTVWE